PLQLGEDGGMDPPCQGGFEPQDLFEIRRLRSPLAGELGGELAELLRGVGGEQLGSPVNGVQGLVFGAVSREFGGNSSRRRLETARPGVHRVSTESHVSNSMDTVSLMTMSTLLARNAELLVTMEGREIPGGGLYARDGWIENVGPSDDIPAVADEMV